MNENMILEEWKKSLEFQNVYFTFFVKSFDEGRLRKVANAFNIGKSTASRIIRRVSQAISKLLATKYVQVPPTEEDVNSLVKNFHAQHGFPQCLGATDSTYIRIKQPSCSARLYYINRKGNFTINCQAAEDYRYCFFDVVMK